MKDITLNIEDKNDIAHINIQGKLNIDTVEQLIPELNAALDKFKGFNFTIENTSQIDLAAMQLFISIHKTLKQEEKQSSFNFKIDDKIQESLQGAGLLQLLN